MKSFTLSAAVLFAASSVSAQYNATAPTSTIMIKPACPSAAPADVMVTRSAIAVPSCEAGSGSNATKPTIVSMSSGMGGSMGGSGSATKTGSTPAMFTGAAEGVKVGGAMIVLGGLAALVL